MFNNRIDSNLGNSDGANFIIGRIKNIVLGPYLDDSKTPNPDFNDYSDIGKIRFEMLYSTMASPSDAAVSKPAYPMYSFVKQYPLLNEIVLIVSGPSMRLNEDFAQQDLYYFPPFNIWRLPHHNAFPNLSSYSKFVKKKSGNSEYPNKTTSSAQDFPLGYTFTEKSNVKPLKVFEGDSVIEGRFGQSIRFGSTVSRYRSDNGWSDYGDNGNPITIITNGFGPSKNPDMFSTTVEDINLDQTALYLTNGQKINISVINQFPFDSFGGISTESNNVTVLENPPVVTTNSSAAAQDNIAINE